VITQPSRFRCYSNRDCRIVNAATGGAIKMEDLVCVREQRTVCVCAEITRSQATTTTTQPQAKPPVVRQKRAVAPVKIKKAPIPKIEKPKLMPPKPTYTEEKPEYPTLATILALLVIATALIALGIKKAINLRRT